MSSPKTSSSAWVTSRLDEVGPADGDGAVVLGHVAAEGCGERGVVGQRRVATDAGDVLHATLGGQAVVVPPDGVEDGLALHALVAGDGVGVRVAEHVADVQRTADGGWRRVDREHPLAARITVEAVGGVSFPPLHPAGLDAVERRLVRDVRRVVGHGVHEATEPAAPLAGSFRAWPPRLAGQEASAVKPPSNTRASSARVRTPTLS